MKTLFNLLFIAVMLIVDNAYAQDVQVITALDNGCKIWTNDGQLHRLTGPAIECPKGQSVVFGQRMYVTFPDHHMIINLPNNEFIEVAIELPKELEYTAITTMYAVDGIIVSPEYLMRWYKCYNQLIVDDGGTYCDPVQMIPNRFSKPGVIGMDGAKYWLWFDHIWRKGAPSFIDNIGNKFWCAGVEPCGTPESYYRDILTNPGPSVEYANGTKEWWYKGVQYSEEDYNKLRKEIRAQDAALVSGRHGESIK